MNLLNMVPTGSGSGCCERQVERGALVVPVLHTRRSRLPHCHCPGDGRLRCLWPCQWDMPLFGWHCRQLLTGARFRGAARRPGASQGSVVELGRCAQRASVPGRGRGPSSNSESPGRSFSEGHTFSDRATQCQRPSPTEWQAKFRRARPQKGAAASPVSLTGRPLIGLRRELAQPAAHWSVPGGEPGASLSTGGRGFQWHTRSLA